MKSSWVSGAALVASSSITALTAAVNADGVAAFGTRIPVPGIEGALVICGEGRIPEAAAAAFVELAGGPQARMVLIAVAPGDDSLRPWTERGVENVSILSAKPDQREVASLARASAVWIEGAAAADLVGHESSTTIRAHLRAVLSRGGVVGAASAGGSALAEWMVGPGPRVDQGFGLLPGCLIDSSAPPTEADRVLGLLEERPGFVGFVTGPSAALVVQGRRARVIGRSGVVVAIPGSASRPARRDRLGHGQVVDLIALSRAAVARTQAPFPPPEPRAPQIANGTLFIGGGGRLPERVIERFIEAAGGPNALIVVIPTAIGGPGRTAVGERDAQLLRRAGARRLRVLDAATPQEAEAPEFLTRLREAGGIWFSGGRQWRLVDSYLDTTAHELMRGVLSRGGAVWGSSAGASIQAEYMVRGHPLGNRVMMAEGYERGLGFLPGVAIDQHFAQRNRYGDMNRLKRTYPQLVGIGIDEGTMLIVRGQVMEVVGSHRVAVFDQPHAPRAGERTYTQLRARDRYDLLERRRLPRPR